MSQRQETVPIERLLTLEARRCIAQRFGKLERPVELTPLVDGFKKGGEKMTDLEVLRMIFNDRALTHLILGEKD